MPTHSYYCSGHQQLLVLSGMLSPPSVIKWLLSKGELAPSLVRESALENILTRSPHIILSSGTEKEGDVRWGLQVNPRKLKLHFSLLSSPLWLCCCIHQQLPEAGPLPWIFRALTHLRLPIRINSLQGFNLGYFLSQSKNSSLTSLHVILSSMRFSPATLPR